MIEEHGEPWAQWYLLLLRNDAGRAQRLREGASLIAEALAEAAEPESVRG